MMEIIAILFSLIALVISIFSMKRQSVPVQVDVYIPEQQIKVVEIIRVLESRAEEVLSAAPEPVSVSNGSQSQSAWKNQTGIPMNETKYMPSPGRKPPTSGPLERPAGFTR